MNLHLRNFTLQEIYAQYKNLSLEEKLPIVERALSLKLSGGTGVKETAIAIAMDYKRKEGTDFYNKLIPTLDEDQPYYLLVSEIIDFVEANYSDLMLKDLNNIEGLIISEYFFKTHDDRHNISKTVYPIPDDLAETVHPHLREVITSFFKAHPFITQFIMVIQKK
ncbi:MAG: hypothetical protein HRT87_04515 [Legionellales bacterium]|nr:hypothetical protein [Legionellales bacterium]